MTLFEPYLGKGHTLMTDNLYSSTSLSLELHKNLPNAYGTVRRNRLGIPELDKNINKDKKYISVEMDGQKESVNDFHTSYHCSNMIDTNKIHCLTEEKINKLQCIIDYNSTMGVVDKV